MEVSNLGYMRRAAFAAKYLLALLQGANSISQDFATQVQRIIALGFNSVELPFSFKALLGGSPDPIPTACRDASFALLMV